VVGILAQPSVDGVAGIADRDFPNERIDQKVDACAGEQREHPVDWLAPEEEVEADEAAHHDNRHTQVAVEVLLDVQAVVTAPHTVPDEVIFLDGGIRPKRDGFLTPRAGDARRDGRRREGNFPIAVTAP
jgi:hypothetical protein